MHRLELRLLSALTFEPLPRPLVAWKWRTGRRVFDSILQPRSHAQSNCLMTWNSVGVVWWVYLNLFCTLLEVCHSYNFFEWQLFQHVHCKNIFARVLCTVQMLCRFWLHSTIYGFASPQLRMYHTNPSSKHTFVYSVHVDRCLVLTYYRMLANLAAGITGRGWVLAFVRVVSQKETLAIPVQTID